MQQVEFDVGRDYVYLFFFASIILPPNFCFMHDRPVVKPNMANGKF